MSDTNNETQQNEPVLTEEQKAIIRANFGGVIPKKPKIQIKPKE